ncbi:hypothetical protein F5X99DRAFT_367293 [Biscogniauxia marginata]|nr:hypothetical protein F5X99DRAFT_367293 [Biscogniauxia marginata]
MLYLSAHDVYKVFFDYQQSWERSEDCAELKHTVRGLVQGKRLAKIDVIVCFGLGPLADYWLLCPFFHAVQKDTATGCTQHAAALTIATLLAEQDAQEKIQEYAQDPRYRQGDIEALKSLDIEFLNHEHGIQEGFMMVDGNTFVFSINTGNFLQQIICETNRPAAMIWSGPDPNDWEETQTFPRILYILVMEYNEYEVLGSKRRMGTRA